MMNVVCHTHDDRVGGCGLGSFSPHFGEWQRHVDGRYIHYALYFCTLYATKALAERYRYIATAHVVRERV